MKRALTNILVILVMFASLAAAPQSIGPSSTIQRASTSSTQVETQKPFQVGKASWYGKYFHGRLTASGEPYDMFLFTAAHRELKLGTMVKVTNLKNGQSIIVRVNDRGPVPETRIIDLSYGAAQVLGFRAKGLENVRLDIIESPRETARASKAGMP